MPTSPAEPLFHEEQPLQIRRLRWRVAILPILLTTLAAAQIGLGPRFGPHPVSSADLVVTTVLLWLVYAWLIRVRLVTDVARAGVTVGLSGFFRRHRVASKDLAACRETDFDARRDFGGYGFRRIGTTRTFIAGGTHGVRIELSEGGVVVIGSARPAELAAALARAREGRP